LGLLALPACELVASLDTPRLEPRDGGASSDGVAAGDPFVRVALRGNAVGHVTSTPPGIDCPGTCAAAFAPGTSVRLTADPPVEDVGRGLRFGGWDGDGCAATSPTCDVHVESADAERGARFYQRVNLAFVSSTVSDGAMGGVAAADTRCAQLAAEAGLPGHYVAWLSEASNAAVDRLGTGSGWVRVDGKPFAATRVDLLAGRILYPLRIDEHGRDVVDAEQRPLVFTGTSGDGQPTGSDCTGWTEGDCGLDCIRPADTGSPAGGTDRWTTASLGGSCGRMAHIYCLGTDLAVPAPKPPLPTDQQSIVWVSSVPYQPGVGNIDDLCRHDATSFGMEGGDPRSIHAVLGTPPTLWVFTNVANRPPTHFVRPDGVVPVASMADFLDGHGFRAPMNVAPGPTYLGGNARVWLGANDMDKTATDSVCEGMTSELFSTISVDPAVATMEPQLTPCNTLQFVWCVQYREEIP
jgi:hypothetical protein